jgi:hypothetical protein
MSRMTLCLRIRGGMVQKRRIPECQASMLYRASEELDVGRPQKLHLSASTAEAGR